MVNTQVLDHARLATLSDILKTEMIVATDPDNVLVNTHFQNFLNDSKRLVLLTVVSTPREEHLVAAFQEFHSVAQEIKLPFNPKKPINLGWGEKMLLCAMLIHFRC
jgi:hypothetical protein